jgi:hypothetical protein
MVKGEVCPILPDAGEVARWTGGEDFEIEPGRCSFVQCQLFDSCMTSQVIMLAYCAREVVCQNQSPDFTG